MHVHLQSVRRGARVAARVSAPVSRRFYPQKNEISQAVADFPVFRAKLQAERNAQTFFLLISLSLQPSEFQGSEVFD